MRVKRRAEVRIYCGPRCGRSLGRYSFDGLRLRVIRLPKGMTEWNGGPKPAGAFFGVEWSGSDTAMVHAVTEESMSKPEEVKYRWRCERGHSPVVAADTLGLEVNRQGGKLYLS